MNILITGGAGFIGSHLAARLLLMGHQVVVVDDLSTGLRGNLGPQVTLHQRSVCEPLDDLFAELRPEVVFHLAAQVSVPRSVVDPRNDLRVNVEGAINVMETAARHCARKVVAMSSAAVYGQPTTIPVTEASPTVPVAPYGLSKLSAEQYIRLLGDLRGIAYTIIRPANIFGPGQTADSEGAVVPAFLNRFLRGIDPVIHGDGSQTRDFLFVADMVDALVRAMHRADSLTLNASSGQGTTVMGLWLEMARLLGWSRPPVFGPARAADIQHSVMANGSACRHLDWRPRYSLGEGLSEMLASASAAQPAAGVDAQ